MSYNTLKRENKCWSCSHYSSERRIDKSLISGTGVRCDNNGKCACSESPNFRKDVSEYSQCDFYKILDSIERSLAIEEKLEAMNRVEYDSEPSNNIPVKAVEDDSNKKLDLDDINRKRDLEFIRRSREIIKAREEEKIRRTEEKIRRAKRKRLALLLISIGFGVVLFLFVMVLVAVLYTPKRVIDRYLGQYDNHEYVEIASNSDYEYTFSFSTLTHGEYFDATHLVNITNQKRYYKRIEISMIFTYGSTSGMNEISLTLYTNDDRFNLIYEVTLEKCPNIKRISNRIDYQEGTTNLTDSDYEYCFNVIGEFYACIDKFLKKIDPTYSLWSFE